MNLPIDQLPKRALIIDEILIRQAYEFRTRFGNLPHDEVWDGELLVLFPLPDNEHQEIRGLLGMPLHELESRYFALGCNISDRHKGWLSNDRCPDVVLNLKGNPARDCGTHKCGGPDFLVEIASPGEKPRDKLDFYAKGNTREVLIIDRTPWALELYQLKRRKLVSMGRSTLKDRAVLASNTLPFSFQLKRGKERPTILVTHTATGQTWTA